MLVNKAYNAFDAPCKGHDLAYDLIKYGHRKGWGSNWDRLGARMAADYWLFKRMSHVCDKTGWFGIFNSRSCRKTAVIMYAGLFFWTAIQQGNL